MNLFAVSIIGGAILAGGVLWQSRKFVWSGRSGSRDEPIVKQFVPAESSALAGSMSNFSQIPASSSLPVAEPVAGLHHLADSSEPSGDPSDNLACREPLETLNQSGGGTDRLEERESLEKGNGSEEGDGPEENNRPAVAESAGPIERQEIKGVPEAETKLESEIGPESELDDQPIYGRTEGVTYIVRP